MFDTVLGLPAHPLFVHGAVVLLPLMGNHGLWAALLVSFVARGITLGLRYPALEAEAEGAG